MPKVNPRLNCKHFLYFAICFLSNPAAQKVFDSQCGVLRWKRGEQPEMLQTQQVG